MTSIIFFDTDCISSFLWTNTEFILIELYGKIMQLPIQVYLEISKVPFLKAKVDILLSKKFLKLIDIEVDTDEERLYNELTTFHPVPSNPLIGKGEAASIVHALYKCGTLASNNFKDIRFYIEKYDLDYTCTADILNTAVNHALITISKAEIIWSQMLQKKRRLPFSSFSEFLANK